MIQVELIEDQTQRVGDLQGEGVTFESQIGLLAKLMDRFVEGLSLVLGAREDLRNGGMRETALTQASCGHAASTRCSTKS